MTLYFLKYNNYYNRKFKIESTLPILTPYLQYVVGQPYENINFVPNDGVDTVQVLGTVNQPWQYNDPDYMLVVNEYNSVISRWFVIDSTRIREGQYRLTLHRDLIADNYDSILTSPMYVEKARINNIEDPAIFNTENFSFNQIKTEQLPIKDETGVGWLVGYVARSDETASEEDKNVEFLISDRSDHTGTTLSSFTDLYPYLPSSAGSRTRLIDDMHTTYYIRIDGKTGAFQDVNKRYEVNKNGPGLVNVCEAYDNAWNQMHYNAPGFRIDEVDLLKAYVLEHALSNDECVRYINEVETTAKYMTQKVWNELYNKYNNKIITVTSENKSYKVNFHTNPSITGSIDYDSSKSPFVTDEFKNALDRAIAPDASSPVVVRGNGNDGIKPWVQINYTDMEIQLTEVAGAGYKYKTTIPTTRYHADDSPFDIFAIPFANDGTKMSFAERSTSPTPMPIDYAASFKCAQEISRVMGQRVYDIQLLPYCPVKNLKKPGLFFLSFDDMDENVDYTIIKKQDASSPAAAELSASFVLWAHQAQFSLSVTSPKVVPYEGTAYDIKVERESTMFRLSSPNWSSQFEFSPYTNLGLNTINIDCYYKPGMPYVHVAPKFDGLYAKNGMTFNDARGLILSGDFSITMTQSQWENYAMMNKNYQNIFDRNIQNMEFNQRQERIERGISIAAEATAAGASGFANAAAGVVLQNPGQVAGGVVEVASGVAGAVVEWNMLKARQAETMDYTKDLFNMQIGNIKAVPNTLTKVSAYNQNNPIFPVLEVYTATDIEKKAFRDKLRYNGMTINRIGTLQEFLPQDGEEMYFKAKLIRNNDMQCEYHEMVSLADELNNGFYINPDLYTDPTVEETESEE